MNSKKQTVHFKLSPLLLACLSSFSTPLYADVVMGFQPDTHDSQYGVLPFNSGVTAILNTQNDDVRDSFISGMNGSIETAFQTLLDEGKVDDPTIAIQVLESERLVIGSINSAISIPDPITNGKITMKVYNSNNFQVQAPIGVDTKVPDFQNVYNEQYINMRIAELTNGVLNVALGAASAASADDTNKLVLAAKQSTLFNVDGAVNNSTLNWQNNNRIHFSASAIDFNQKYTYTIKNVVVYLGSLTVVTADGETHNRSVTTNIELVEYNNWLIEQLEAGNMVSTEYATHFNKAVSVTDKQVVYSISADNPNDDLFQGYGTRQVIAVNGPNGIVNIESGKTLEGVNASAGVIMATAGAAVNVASGATVASQNGTAIHLTGQNTKGVNDGVINGNFVINDGKPQGLFSSSAVKVEDGGDLQNNGIINQGSNATDGTTTISAGISMQGGVNGATANNSGVINVGINASSSNAETVGILINDATSVFENNAGGLIYIGRGPQTLPSDIPADVALNQTKITSGISVKNGGTATNSGDIVIGTLTQNAAGIRVTGDSTVMTNNGTITINGKATKVPNENVGILVENGGKDGNVINHGTINLNGINASGIKVVSTTDTEDAYVISSNQAVINIEGDLDPSSGVRNYGIWVEGKKNGLATADINSEINLKGNGAIGVHARGNAQIELSQNAIPHFITGEKQIGFFAYGDKAKINVNGTLNLTVNTKESTLFRVENGADFNGQNITMNIDGEGAMGVMGTGNGTVVESAGGTYNINGDKGIGFQVEGGATGTIDTATHINLNGDGTVAAIVDGQKHNLAGANSGNHKTNTSLNSSAQLVSAKNDLTGYIARNQATFTNSGDITFTGDHSTGILVESGATGINSGNLTIHNGGVGMLVESGTSGLVTTAMTEGGIIAEGGDKIDRTIGIVAVGDKSIGILKDNTNVILNGIGAVGGFASRGGTINIDPVSLVNFNNTDQIGYYAKGVGSTINSSQLASEVDTERSALYRIDDGATLNLMANSVLSASGESSTAVIISGVGSHLSSGNTSIIVKADNALGLHVDGGATADVDAQSTIDIQAVNGIGGIVDGIRTTLTGEEQAGQKGSILANAGNVISSSTGATGFIAKRGGTLKNSGSITLDGNNNTGVLLQGAMVNNTGTILIKDGTGIRVDTAAESVLNPGRITVNNGIAGIQVQNGASLSLNGNSNNKITTNGTAHAILLDTGAKKFVAQNTNLDVLGSGNGIENFAELNNIVLKNMTINVKDGAGIRTATPLDASSSAKITVAGAGTGFAFRKADGSVTAADLVLGDKMFIGVNGVGGNGIHAFTTGAVTLKSIVTVNHAQGGSALIAGTASSTLNQGTLQSISTTAPTVDLRNGNGTEFQNNGQIIAASSTATAIAGSNGNDTIVLAGGAVRGDVATGNGSDYFLFSNGELNGSLTMGNGDGNRAEILTVSLRETTHLTAGSGANNSLAFKGTRARGGSFVSDDLVRGVNLGTGWSTVNFTQGAEFSLVDNLKLANSNVNIDRSSILYTGNNVNPTIAGSVDNSVTVTNAGNIDMTSRLEGQGNRLTIDGNINSLNGRVHARTYLNDGGSMANQDTDKLLVEGNATGTTNLTVYAAFDSPGMLADLNHTGTIEAYEGISLAQVAGNSTRGAFVLSNGDIIAGPWSYQLYSFAPGESDASQREVAGVGDQFWDYRLANAYYCGPSTDVACSTLDKARPGVIAQVPSYISSQVGLAHYASRLIDDLHKRLGEIRHQQKHDNVEDTNIFSRYIGANYKYDTSVSFQNFGYDFDIDMNAAQIGFNIIRLYREKDNFLAGLAYTRGHTRIKPHAVDGESKTNFDTDNIALYFTWQKSNGFYTDAVVFGDLYRGSTTVGGADQVARLRGHGIGFSIETGYPFKLKNKVELEPQFQVMHQRLHFKDFIDQNRNRVSMDRYQQTIVRLGARMDKTYITDRGHRSTPYLRVNYIGGWGNSSKVEVSAVSLPISHTFDGGKFGNTVEVGIGETYSFKNDISLYAEVDYRHKIGSHGVKGLQYDAGIRWTF